MPQSNSSKKRASLRRCATCDRIGHNARTCTYGKAMISSAVFATEEKKKQTPKKTSVSIPVFQGEPPRSRHVVSLKNEALDKAWESITVYQPEKSKGRETRVPIDFAQMIKNANQPRKADEISVTKKPDVDILKEIARIEGVRDIPFTVEPKQFFKKITVETSEESSDHSWNMLESVEIPRTSLKDRIQETREKIRQSFHIKKFALSVAVLGLLVTLPFPAVGFYRKVEDNTNKIVQESTNAFLSLQSSTVAAFNQNLPQAELDLNHALNSFGAARTMIDKEYKALTYVLDLIPVVGTKIKSRQELLEAGHFLALGNAYLIKGIDQAVQDPEATTVERLKILRTHIRGALPQYEEAVARLDKVAPESIPVEYQESFTEFRTLFHTLVADIKNVSDVISGLELMLGSDGFKRYLIVFQNQYELRPTGGFIGSYATLDVQSGKILKMDVPGGGSYDLQGQLSVHVRPPLPLQLINERWEFQDGNWFPDFKASGQKLAWFYEKSRNTTVDGVIAINASVLERLLRIIGPVQNDEYDLILTGDSAIKNLIYEIESYDNADGKNEPKAVLSVLLEQITKVMNEIQPPQLISMVTELSDALSEREIQTYFVDNRVQSTMKSYGWTGELLQNSEKQDYLMVVNTNIGGGKSDANVVQTIEHQAEVMDDGSIIDTVVITRTHEGIDESDTLLGQMNGSYIRVYVPEGAELIDAGGFLYPDDSSFNVGPSWYTEDTDLLSLEHEQSIHNGSGTRIVKEFGKTSFGNWIVTYPEQKTQVYFTYKLPFKAFDLIPAEATSDSVVKDYFKKVMKNTGDTTSRYSMILQKQSGIESEYSHTVIYPDHWRPMWRTGEQVSLSLNGASIHGILSSDTVYGIIMKQE